MQRICEKSGRLFSLTQRELEFLERRELPPPRLCPEERLRRRLSFRNQRQLFRRSCSKTGKPLISIYPPEHTGPVVSLAYWYGDEWDGRDYGRPFDFNKSFFEQFQELLLTVPLPSSMVTKSENCEYNAYCAQSRNCYLCQSSVDSENVCYTNGPTRCRDCLESHTIDGSELCFEVLHGTGCYDVQESKNVVHCRESSFLLNCRNCSNCCFCVNLRNAQYCFENRQLTKEQYLQAVQPYQQLSFAARQAAREKFARFAIQFPAPALWGSMYEAVSGNYIFNSKSVRSGFDILDCEDIDNGFRLRGVKSAADASFVYMGEELYEYMSGSNPSRCRFSFALFESPYDVEYSATCSGGCHDLFGCVGLRHAECCILNQPYSRDEYHRLREKIVRHMRDTGEYGEFFPSELSPFAYNDTVAYDFLPLEQNAAERLGYRWMARIPEERTDTGPTQFPSEYGAPVSVLKQTFACRDCSRPFKIQQLELQLAEKLRSPLPHLCFECRNRSRLSRLEPLQLFERACVKCGHAIRTPFSPDRPELICCESCYQAQL